LADGIDDGVVIWAQAMRDEAFLQVEPESLDRVPFG
jgi:hypothetical protein